MVRGPEADQPGDELGPIERHGDHAVGDVYFASTVHQRANNKGSHTVRHGFVGIAEPNRVSEVLANARDRLAARDRDPEEAAIR